MFCRLNTLLGLKGRFGPKSKMSGSSQDLLRLPHLDLGRALGGPLGHSVPWSLAVHPTSYLGGSLAGGLVLFRTTVTT